MCWQRCSDLRTPRTARQTGVWHTHKFYSLLCPQPQVPLCYARLIPTHPLWWMERLNYCVLLCIVSQFWGSYHLSHPATDSKRRPPAEELLVLPEPQARDEALVEKSGEESMALGGDQKDCLILGLPSYHQNC